MRCLSPHPRYSIQVFEGKEQIVMDPRGYGNSVVLEKPVIANFERSGLLDHEIEAALERFEFSGLPEGVNPLTRISVFDTEAFVLQTYKTKDERTAMQPQVDERLRELQKMNPNQYIIVEAPAALRPWPSYDEDSVEDVLKIQERIRVNPESIRLYELENKNREEIVEAMLRQEDPEGAARLYGPAPEEDIVVDA